MGHEFGVRHGGLHIPLVVAGLPGVAPGRIDAPVRLVDLSASVLAWAGLEQPAELAGTPLPTSPRPDGEGGRALRAAYSDSLTVIPEVWGDLFFPLDREAVRSSCGPGDKVFGGMASQEELKLLEELMKFLSRILLRRKMLLF